MGEPFAANIVGLGYVGSAIALFLARRGIEAHGLDLDPNRAAALRAGRLPFPDPDLLSCYRNIQGNLLHLTSDPKELPKARIWIICVGTPSEYSGGSLDVSGVVSALRTVLSQCLSQGDL